MRTTTAAIFEAFSQDGLLTAMEGEDTALSGIAAIEDCGPGDLVFVEQAKAVEPVLARKPSAVVTSGALQPMFAGAAGVALLIAPNVKLAHALLRQRYADPDPLDSEWPAVHPSAVIHSSCEIGEGSRIGPNVTLGRDVKIGPHTAVMAGTVVEHGAAIGNRCVIHPNVTIGYDCAIGDQVIIQSSAVIGAEGYGFAQDPQGRSQRIPQTGRVVIEERVSVGAGCCIDRATYAETRIGAGTKLDNLCHIAHNVVIGQDCLLTAGFSVAGSTKVGNRVVASGQTGVLDHLEICDDVVLLHRAGVTQSIDRPGMYAGLPVRPLSEYKRTAAVLNQLAEMRKKVRQLEKKLGNS